MLRVWAALCTIASLCSVSDPAKPEVLSPSQIYARVRDNVVQQIKQSTNYTCTEVLDRLHAYTPLNREASCDNSTSTAKRPYMHDRLRLDVAVSSTGEIFSWHGGKVFSSSGISSIVKTGAVSSGSFIGYLSNVFLPAGVVIRYTGRNTSGANTTFLFSYDVPLASSKVQLGAQRVLVPFHGTFGVDAKTFQLTNLDVVIDNPPPRTELCSASMHIGYQIVNISNQLSLIPQIFSLDARLVGHQFNTSRTEFTDCHAFRGESTIHYESLDETEAAKIQAGPEQILPERLKLYASVSSPINDKDSFTGDPVEATLLSPVALRGSDIRIRKGASLKGIITKLEYYYEPIPHYRLSIRLESVTDGTKTYRMNGVLQTPLGSSQQLLDVYQLHHREMLPPEPSGGQLIFIGKTFHTSRNTNAVWITSAIAGE